MSDVPFAPPNMFCATARPSRTIHVLGTKGEIEGDMEDGIIKVRTPLVKKGRNHSEEVIDVNITGGEGQGGHGGGDERLVADFASVIRGYGPSKSVTNIQDSLTGHLIAFAADTAMREGRVVDL